MQMTLGYTQTYPHKNVFFLSKISICSPLYTTSGPMGWLPTTLPTSFNHLVSKSSNSFASHLELKDWYHHQSSFLINSTTYCLIKNNNNIANIFLHNVGNLFKPVYMTQLPDKWRDSSYNQDWLLSSIMHSFNWIRRGLLKRGIALKGYFGCSW